MINSVFFHLTIELLFGFIGLLISVKIIGKRQMQQVSAFDFVSAIVLGELLGNAIYNSEITIFHVLYGITIWTLLLFIIEKVVQKSRKVRIIIEGSPKLVIKNGLIDYQVLSKEKLDFSELTTMLRNKDVFSIREIEYAIIEPNGTINVIKKSPYENVTIRDLNISNGSASLSLPLIIEGKIELNNLRATGHDKNWLIDNLQQQKVQNIKEVLYAEWNQSEGFYIQKINTNLSSN